MLRALRDREMGVLEWPFIDPFKEGYSPLRRGEGRERGQLECKWRKKVEEERTGK